MLFHFPLRSSLWNQFGWNPLLWLDLFWFLFLHSSNKHCCHDSDELYYDGLYFDASKEFVKDMPQTELLILRTFSEFEFGFYYFLNPPVISCYRSNLTFTHLFSSMGSKDHLLHSLTPNPFLFTHYLLQFSSLSKEGRTSIINSSLSCPKHFVPNSFYFHSESQSNPCHFIEVLVTCSAYHYSK